MKFRFLLGYQVLTSLRLLPEPGRCTMGSRDFYRKGKHARGFLLASYRLIPGNSPVNLGYRNRSC
jgi:hypothetical protein